MGRKRAKSQADAVGEEKRADAEAVLLERLAFERLLVDLSERLSEIASADLFAGTERVLRRLLTFLGYDRCTFSEFVAGDYLNVLCSVGDGGMEPLPRGRFPFPLQWFLNELRSGRIVAMANLPDDLPPEAFREAEHCRQIGLRSHISIPVRIGGRVTSVLSFASVRQARAWPPELIARLRIVGELLGSTIALARSEEEARDLRRHIWHADRVQRVGALTAAIAHELNQPLAAILSNAQAGLRYLDGEEAAPGVIKDVLEAVVQEDKRAAETIRTMRALIRHDESRRERVDIGAATGEAWRLLESEFGGQDVRIETRFDADCHVMADKVQIQQVVLNLLLNASAALQGSPPAKRIVQLQVARRDPRVLVSVRDAGEGIDAPNLTSIFEPFWTTRQDGLGLGLAICRSIVEAHGGRIWAESNEEGGVTFSFELPLAESEVAASQGLPEAHRASRAAAHHLGEETAQREAVVCVIDDDAAVRESLLRLLAGDARSAVGYASADEFLAHPPAGEVVCILSDVRMPGPSGVQLQQRLGEQQDPPPIIFITGHGSVRCGIEAMKLGAADFLEKPVDDKVLLAAVHCAVERHAGERRQALARETLRERAAHLSARERQIMEHVVRGRLNKQIAADLLIAEQTVKQHRGRVMEKMGVRSVADLVRAWEAAGLDPAASASARGAAGEATTRPA